MVRTLTPSTVLLALLCACFYLACSPSAGATDIIITLAGGGSIEGYKPDEANLALGAAQGMAISPRGEIYFSDANRQQVLKLNPATGLISLVAGNGARAYSGDGLPAVSAALNQPGGLTFDSATNLLIADRGNFVVRRVDAVSGIISTIAGSGLATGQVVGTNPPAALGDGGSAVAATFGTMGDLAVDGTDAVIVSDSGNACVRKFTVGGTINTIAGTPGNSGFSGDGVIGGALAAKFNTPTGVAIDSAGAIYIGDSGNRRVRRLTSDATVATVVGTGGSSAGFNGDGMSATSAQIGSVGGLQFDPSGDLLITCVGANRVRKSNVGAATPIILTIAGNGGADVLGDNGPATGANLASPRDLAPDALGNVFILDSGHQRIRRVDQATGFIDTVVGTGLTGFVGDRGPRQGGVLSNPAGSAYDAAGNLYIADTGNRAVRRIAPDGTITTVAGDGTANGLGDGGPAALASLSSPQDVLVVDTNLFIADANTDRIRAVDLTTGLIRTYANISAPVAIIADASGLLYVAHDNQVDTVDQAGAVRTFAGNSPVDTVNFPLGDGLSAANATLNSPRGLALNAAGELFIADTGNDLIRKIGAAPGLVVSTVAGGGTQAFPSVGDGGAATSATLNGPVGVAVDAARILIADTGDQRIRSVDLGTGIITTICGDGTPGFDGDGDLAASAEVNSPGRIIFNGPNLVIADGGNNRIRQIVPALDMNPKLLRLSAKFNFAVDKKTGQIARGKDSVSIKTALSLPAGISATNLDIHVDIVDLHQQEQFDANGKPPILKKPAPVVTSPFGSVEPTPPPPLATRYSFPFKGLSVAGSKPVSFTFSAAGKLPEELGRAGFSNVTTPKAGVTVPVRVNVTIGPVTFTGVASTIYKASQGKGGLVLTPTPK